MPSGTIYITNFEETDMKTSKHIMILLALCGASLGLTAGIFFFAPGLAYLVDPNGKLPFQYSFWFGAFLALVVHRFHEIWDETDTTFVFTAIGLSGYLVIYACLHTYEYYGYGWAVIGIAAYPLIVYFHRRAARNPAVIAANMITDQESA